MSLSLAYFLYPLRLEVCHYMQRSLLGRLYVNLSTNQCEVPVAYC